MAQVPEEGKLAPPPDGDGWPEIAQPEPPAPACDRCGTFAPLTARGTRQLCAACLARAPLDLESTPATAGPLLAGTFRLLVEVLPVAMLLGAIVEVPLLLLVIVYPEMPELAYNAYNGFVSVVGDIAITLYAVRRLDGEPISWWAALGSAILRWPTLIAVTLVIFVAAIAGAFACVIPALWVLVTFALATPIASVETSNPLLALKESAQRIDGHRLSLFGAMLVIGVPTFGMIKLIEFGLAQMWEAWPVGASQAAIDATVLGLNTVLFLAVYPFIGFPARLLPVVAYLKLRHGPRIGDHAVEAALRQAQAEQGPAQGAR